MTPIRGYMAMTLDGYIADKDGGYDFLKRYENVDYGFGEFFAEIGTCVFGRATFDQSIAMPREWPFAGKRVIVVSSRHLVDPPANTELWSIGVDQAFVDYLRSQEGGDIWIVGGGKLQGALFELGAIDRLQAGVIPLILGDGIPMFPKSSRQQWLELTNVSQFPLGGVMLDYRRPAG